MQEVIPVNSTHRNSQDTRLLDALGAEDSATRLKAAMAAGTSPDPGLVDALVERCAVEPDFFVRDMLTWALTRLPSEVMVHRVIAELRSERPQARSQALHTLSKVGDGNTWPAITRSLLHDADDEVARSAWRASVILVPDDEKKGLAMELTTQLGRGDRNVQRSLSRALVALGDVIEPALQTGLASKDPTVQAHARATEQLLQDPDAGFDSVIDEAKRLVALQAEPR